MDGSVSKTCKFCKYFFPTEFIEFDTQEKYNRNIIEEKDSESKMYGQSTKNIPYKILKIYSNTYGRCGNIKLKACGFQDEEFIKTDDQALFSDAGECPDLFVGINFGCIHHKEK